MNVIETHGLRKSYGRREVLHGIDLTVPSGSLFGFLGPNGAGKTTTIRILLGLLRANDGLASVFGKDCWHQGPSLRRDVGCLSGDVRLYDHLTGSATLQFFDRARRRDSSAEIRRLVYAFDLDVSRKVRGYSRGMKQKLGLIQALMHQPKLLILDEPTITLDPLIREVLFAELRRVRDEGRTVLFSSHTLNEVDQLCNWVAIVREGNLIEQDRVDMLRRRAVRHVEVLLNGDDAGASPPEGFVEAHRSRGRLTGSWSGKIQPLLAWLSKCSVRDVVIAPPDLEDLFLEYYSDNGSDVDHTAPKERGS